jgi:hypothetical protein
VRFEDEKNSSEFFKIDQSTEARWGDEKNSSEFFEIGDYFNGTSGAGGKTRSAAGSRDPASARGKEPVRDEDETCGYRNDKSPHDACIADDGEKGHPGSFQDDTKSTATRTTNETCMINPCFKTAESYLRVRIISRNSRNWQRLRVISGLLF